MKINEILTEEYHPYFSSYINKLDADMSLRKRFEEGRTAIMQFFGTIPQDKLDYRYDRDKWSVKEVLQHLIDTERIFIYRCFRIGRNDKTSLAPYDQNMYNAPSGAASKSMDSLLREYATTRDASIMLINSLSDDDLCRIGTANEGAMSARAAAAIILGHEIWHMDIINERYL